MSNSEPKDNPTSQSGATNEAASLYGGGPNAANQKRTKVSTTRIAQMRANGEKIAVLTAYDATFAAVADAAGVDCVMVGDSLGMVCQGRTTTVGVSLEEMCYHTQCVSQGIARVQGSALIIADLPFGSYQQSRDQAIASAVQLMQAGAHMVKLEGGGWVIDVAAFLVERGIPVCGHLGLTPQTVSALGGYRVQGRQEDAAKQMHADASALDAAGASMMVLEMVPARLATGITGDMKNCATIGIGAGSGTAGQVLVMHDMLGLNLGRMAKFVQNFMEDAQDVQGAFATYVATVKNGSFPNDELHAW